MMTTKIQRLSLITVKQKLNSPLKHCCQVKTSVTATARAKGWSFHHNSADSHKSLITVYKETDVRAG